MIAAKGLADNFTAYANRLNQVQLGADGPADFSDLWIIKKPTLANIRKTIEHGEPGLPIAYKKGYLDPVREHAARLHGMTDEGFKQEVLAPAYQHNAGNPIDLPLRRLQVVVNGIFKAFLSDRAKAHALAGAQPGSHNITVIESLPPLVSFKKKYGTGPTTVDASYLKNALGAAVGLISVPASFRDDPLLWFVIAHETGGHSVHGAIPHLLDQMKTAVRAGFSHIPVMPVGGKAQPATIMADLWTHWLREASADVFATLSMGPTFAIMNAAFQTVGLSQANSNFPIPIVEQSGHSPGGVGRLQPHPVDLLRIDLSMGVLDVSHHLSQATRDGYLAALETLSTTVGNNVPTIALNGKIPDSSGTLISVPAFPTEQARLFARAAGRIIATRVLDALGGESIEEIENWNEWDESAAQDIAGTIIEGNDVEDVARVSHLLAGANMAVLDDPSRYDAVTKALNHGLDVILGKDPGWYMRPKVGKVPVPRPKGKGKA